MPGDGGGGQQKRIGWADGGDRWTHVCWGAASSSRCVWVGGGVQQQWQHRLSGAAPAHPELQGVLACLHM
jgi:hypothetical protein